MNTNTTPTDVITFLKNEVGHLEGLSRPHDEMSFTAKEAIADSKESLRSRLPLYNHVILSLGNDHPVSKFLQTETEYYRMLIRGRGSIQSEIKHRLPAYRSLIRQLTEHVI